MPVNHMKKFLKSMHIGALFLWSFAQASTWLHRLAITFKTKLFDYISLFWHGLSNAGWADQFLDDGKCSNTYTYGQ